MDRPPPAERPVLTDGVVELHPDESAAPDDRFVITVDGTDVGEVCATRLDQHSASLHWALDSSARGQGYASRAVRTLVDFALTAAGQGGLGYSRVEAAVEPHDEAARRVAARSGLRQEGVRRVARGTGRHPDATEYVIHARLSSDPPLSEPESFRSLLNSFLPRKRAIAQLLVRDPDGRVLMCQLTYKSDWDLPGGVVEVGESPHLAAGREVAEELGLTIEPGDVLLVDWLPPWSGWDDALCLVFDGGVVDPSIVDTIIPQAREIQTAEFLDLHQIRERARDFTARRVEAALLADPERSTYTESGRGCPP